MMKTSVQTLALVGAFVLAGASAGLAQSGNITDGALRQLIAGTDLTTQEARGMTLDEIVAERWQNNSDDGRS